MVVVGSPIGVVSVLDSNVVESVFVVGSAVVVFSVVVVDTSCVVFPDVVVGLLLVEGRRVGV